MKSVYLLFLCVCLITTSCSTASKKTDEGPPASSVDLPFGLAIPDKPGFVTSPYTQNSTLIDVRGFPRGEQVTDPWTNQRFLVP